MVKKEKGEWEKDYEPLKSMLPCKSRSPVSAPSVITDVAVIVCSKFDSEAKSSLFSNSFATHKTRDIFPSSYSVLM